MINFYASIAGAAFCVYGYNTNNTFLLYSAAAMCIFNGYAFYLKEKK